MKIVFLVMAVGLASNLSIYAYFFTSITALISAVSLLVVVGLLARRWFSVRPVSRDVHGWILGEAEEVSDPNKPVAIDQLTLPADYLVLGALCLGSPKAGKTESFALGIMDQMNHIWPNSGYAFFEGKGDTDIYMKLVAATGGPDYFFSTELSGSCSINLMSGDARDVIDRLKLSLIGHTASTSFYSDEQLARLTLVVPVLKSLGVPVSLRDLYTVVAIEDAERELLRLAQESPDCDAAALSLYQEWVNSEEHGKRVSALQGLLNRLFIFVYGSHTDRLNTYQPDIDVETIVREGKSVYFHLPLTDYTRSVAIALVEMFHVESRRRQNEGCHNAIPFPLFFDDWGAFFHSNFGPFSSRCRSAKLPLFFSFQSLSQMKKVDPAFAAELDDNVANKFIMRVMGQETGEYGVALLGTHDRLEVGLSDMRTDLPGTSLSSREVARFSTQDLKSLTAGEVYISTLVDQDNGTRNLILKTRLPLPDFDGWENISLPADSCTDGTTGDGLNFWLKYMDRTKLIEIQTQAEGDTEAYKEIV
jgi:hypothetical protein